MNTEDRIRKVLKENGRLVVDVDTLAPNVNLPQNGLSSQATVSVMLGIEEEFDVEIPDDMLNADTFQSIDSIANVVNKLSQAEAA